MSFVSFGALEQGHLVSRLFDRLRYLRRKWNGFLHLVIWCAVLSLFFFFPLLLFKPITFRFSGAISFQNREASFCLRFQMRNPAKNRVRLRSRMASSRFS